VNFKLQVSAFALIVFQCSFLGSRAQTGNGFAFGKTTYEELYMKTYDLDTTAEALYLDEFGEAYVKDYDDYNLAYEYHARIKILRAGALRIANFTIPVGKFKGQEEMLTSIEASTFNVNTTNGKIEETKLARKNVYTEAYSKNLDIVKFALPNVNVGSVIEIQYRLETPNLFNFKNWIFQNEFPKKRSEYWATIPGNYIYNISLRGFLKLASQQNEVISDCFRPNGQKADCSRYKFVMKDIPAFTEEEYMTASSNFISAINFELSELKFFDGRTDKITKEWKDVEDELRHENRFGIQLKRGKDILDEQINQIVGSESDPLVKSKKIYEFIKSWYRWDEVNGKYSELGIKKAFDEHKGNVGDINLSLIAALRYAGMDVEPLILSTRDNGYPTDLHPVLSDFNYVVAKLNVQDRVYLLDATDKALPFGVLPMRCLNGKGRVMGDKESYWYTIVPAEKRRRVVTLDLALQPEGNFTGTIKTIYYGYEAIEKRRDLSQFSNDEDLRKDLEKDLKGITINKVRIENAEDLSKPLTENIDVSIPAFDDMKAKSLFFNPFFVERWERNPFRSPERLYPVDFGAQLEEAIVISLTLPPGFSVDEIPEKVALLLPNGGGRYIFGAQVLQDKIIINHSLTLARTLYSSDEYHILKELFNRILQVQNIDLVLKRTN